MILSISPVRLGVGGGGPLGGPVSVQHGPVSWDGALPRPRTDSRIRGKRIQSLKPSPRLPLTWESSLMFPYKGDKGLKVRQLRFKVTV